MQLLAAWHIDVAFKSGWLLTGQCRVDLLSVPTWLAGHHMPNAQSAGVTLLPTLPI